MKLKGWKYCKVDNHLYKKIKVPLGIVHCYLMPAKDKYSFQIFWEDLEGSDNTITLKPDRSLIQHDLKAAANLCLMEAAMYFENHKVPHKYFRTVEILESLR